MNKVGNQRCCAENNQADREPVNALGQVFAGRTLVGGVVSVLESQDQSDATFGAGGIVGGDDLSGFQTGSAEVSVMNLPGIESTWSWCCPSREFSALGGYCEGVLGYEVNCCQPTNLDGVEGIVDFDAASGIDNLWSNNENPEQGASCESVAETDKSVNSSSNTEERNGGCCSNQNNNGEINPVASGAVNVVIGHDSNNTAVSLPIFKDLLTQKGI